MDKEQAFALADQIEQSRKDFKVDGFRRTANGRYTVVLTHDGHAHNPLPNRIEIDSLEEWQNVVDSLEVTREWHLTHERPGHTIREVSIPRRSPFGP